MIVARAVLCVALLVLVTVLGVMFSRGVQELPVRTQQHAGHQ